MQSIAAIIVTYEPNLEKLFELFEILESQVAHILVVDNGSLEKTLQFIGQRIPQNGFLILKGYNSGVAGAINTGILKAKKYAVSHVLLLDQDSLPASDMVNNLLSAMNLKKGEGYKVAAVGPKYSDIKGQHVSPFVKLKGLKLSRVDCNKDEVVEVDHLISSGCLIAMDALAEIGGMEDRLFIDYVDTEWCLRAIYKGHSLFGVGSACMQHDLGNEFVDLFSRTVTVHSSLRYYYLIRNGLWLLRRPWISSAWKIMDSRRLFLRYIVCSLFVGTRFQNWKLMTIGFWHGVTERMGRYN